MAFCAPNGKLRCASGISVPHIINSFRSAVPTCRLGVVVGASNAAAEVTSSLLGYGMMYI